MKTRPGEGVVKEERFPNTRKPSRRQVCGEFWNLRGQHNWEGKKKIPQITHLAASSSEEAAQTLAPASSEQGLTREAQAAFLGWGLGLNALRTI